MNEPRSHTENKYWAKTAEGLPPEHQIVDTKIDDIGGARNQQRLYRQGRLWFFPDGSMYVYYTPTHWSELESDEDVSK